LVDGDDVHALATAPSCGPLEVTTRLGALADLDLLAPVAPTKIVCVGRNYAAHADEHGVEVPAEPLLFFKPPSSVTGPGRAIELPALSERVEHEAELAVVIGRRCRAVTEEAAWGHVLGITCGNDVTARDLQRRDKQWTRGKGFDTFCPLGPWVVTGLAEARVSGLTVCCRVNGEERQRGSTAQMVFSPAHLIAYISAVMTLEVGDVIMTGTPSGVGPLSAGDEVAVDVQGVGVLRNPVV
jgi:2-keto-4-pentenoate hydratase/2-oxohepta-3-ene-1,7-dioic acid hydratase in catechol pathway